MAITVYELKAQNALEAVLERIFYTTLDPNTPLFHGRHLPAATTLLYRICENDLAKFEEACRLMKLFATAALMEVER